MSKKPARRSKAAPRKAAPARAKAPRPARRPAAHARTKPAARARAAKPAPARPPVRPAAAAKPSLRPAVREEPRATYFRDLNAGSELPVLQKGPLTRVQIARYAGASGDFGPLYVDEAAARASGMPSVMVHGMLSMAWAAEHVQSWLKGGRLRRLSARFIKIIWPGDALTFRGRIANLLREGNQCLVELDLRAENQKGELVLRGSALVEVFFSADDEENARMAAAGGALWPPVELQPWPEPRPAPPPPPPAAPAPRAKSRPKKKPKAKKPAKKEKK